MTETDVSVHEIPKADGDHVIMDKENIPQLVITNKTAEVGRGASCTRTPLQSINQDRDGVIRPVYSPITPVSGSRSRTPLSRRKLTTRLDRRKTVCGFRSKPSPLNVMNTLLYNKAKELIEQGLQGERERIKELETLAEEKDEEILRLRTQVSLLSGHPTDASTLPDTSILQDDQSIRTPCKSSGVDYSKKTKEELVTELEAFEMHNRTLSSDLISVQQRCRHLQLELDHTRTARDEDKLCAENALKQVKASFEHRITDLLAFQSQLTQDVSEREKEAASCRSELQKQEKEVTILNESLAKLRDDLSLICEQKQQTADLCNEYRVQRQKDIERLQELEANLDEYAKIRPNIIKARLAQENIANIIRKAHQTVQEKKRAVAAESEEFLKQKVEWLKWKDEKEQSLTAIQENCNCTEKMNQRQEGDITQNDLNEQLVASSESRTDSLLKQIISLESSLESEKSSKCDLIEKLNLAEKQAANVSQMTADIERHELEVTNLQRTLDMREHEIDELTKECNNYKRLATHLNVKSSKQQSVFSKVIDLEQQIKLLEKDKMTVYAEMLELRKKSTELQQLTTDHQLLIEKMRTLEECLKERNDQIRCKEKELSDAVIAVELLFKKASSFFDRLTSQWRAWNTKGVKPAETGTPFRRRSQARTPVMNARRRSRKSIGGPSFISQILSARKQSTPNTKPFDSKMVPVSTISESTMQGKSSQDDHGVIEHGEANDSAEETLLETPQLIRRVSQDSNGSDRADVISHHSSSSSSYGERFTFFLDEIITVFTKMESLLHGEVAVAFSHLRNVVNELDGRLSQQQHTHAKLMKEAQAVVRQTVVEAGEEKKKAEIERHLSTVLKDELKEKTDHANQLLVLLQNKNERLLELVDQSTEIQKLSTQLTSAQKKCELKDEEIRLLKSSLTERWQCLEANSGAKMAVVRDMEQEVISLKVQKQKLMQDYTEDRRKWEESCFRMKEAHRIDARNLRKAEEAIGELDEKIERIRLALQPHLDILKSDEILTPLLREIRAFDF